MTEHECCGHEDEAEIDALDAWQMQVKVRQWAFMLTAANSEGYAHGEILNRAHALAVWLLDGDPPAYDDELPGEAPLPKRPLKPGEPGDYEH